MSGKTDQELWDILCVHSADYTAEALTAAQLEYESRGHSLAEASRDRRSAEEILKSEGEPLEPGMKAVAFFTSTVMLGLPVLLAHRTYIEQGKRQKARDWGRWALYGFGFYACLAILRLLLARFSS